MATSTKSKSKARTPAKKPVKRAASKPVRSAKSSAPSSAYSELTWGLTIVWLVLVAVFLGMVLVRVYGQ